MPIPVDIQPATPIQIARRSYVRWKSPKRFYDDLNAYLEHGIVISRPDIFAMAQVQGDALFVRMAVGNLQTLLSYLPVRLPKIRFYRRNKGRLHEWTLVKLLQTTDKLMKRR
jgi:hypothetical protein